MAKRASATYRRRLLEKEKELLTGITRIQMDGRKPEAFGLCMECGEPAQKQRLQAIPWARNCVVCQELQEKGLL